MSFNEKKIIIWDTEYTSWEGCLENGWDPEKDHYKEVIQIGAVLFDLDKNSIMDEFNIFVKPKKNPELSDYIKNLTGIEQKYIDNAVSFREALNSFHQWCEKNKLYSYGNDLGVIKQNMEINDMGQKIAEGRFKDIKKVFEENDVPTEQWSSGSIAKYFRPEVDLLPQHNALNDSKNMAKAIKLMRNK